MEYRLHCLEVWGDLAGFFPPDAKVERYSYPVITPSAARNIFRAIYINPYEFEWIPFHIALMTEPKYLSILSNELQRISPEKGIVIEEQDVRTQRAGVYLYKPRFRVWAIVRMWEPDLEAQMKHESIFIDRARRGQYRHRPYLGLRELVACFRYIEPSDWFDSEPVDISQDVGPMIYDPWDLRVRPVVGLDGRIDRRETAKLSAPGRFAIFHAIINRGWLTTPDLLGCTPPRLPLPEEVYAH